MPANFACVSQSAAPHISGGNETESTPGLPRRP